MKVLVSQSRELMLSERVAKRIGLKTNCYFDKWGIEVWSISGLKGNIEEKRNEYIKAHSKEFRTNPELIKCVEELGVKASGYHNTETGKLLNLLRIVDVPDDLDFEVVDGYRNQSGVESIQQRANYWMVSINSNEYEHRYGIIPQV